MKNILSLILIITLLSVGCDKILEDPDQVREGLQIEESQVSASTWKVEYFNNQEKNRNPDFEDVFIEFNIDNTFNLINNQNKVYSGQWALSNTKDLLVIRSDGKIPAPYNEIENEWIVLNADKQNLRIQERDPKGNEEFDFREATNDEIPRVCEDIAGLLKDKEWYVEHLIISNENVTSEFEGFNFHFNEEGQVNVVNGDNEHMGSWNAGIRCDKFQFEFESDSPLKPISSLWYLTYFSANTLKLAITRGPLIWELKLVTGEGDGTEFCDEAEEQILDGEWIIDHFSVGNADFTADVSQMTAAFDEDGDLKILNDNGSFEGSWSLVENCETLLISIDGNEIISQLTDEWQLIVISNHLMKLVAETDDIKKEIEFNRNVDPDPTSFCDSFKRLLDKENNWAVSYYQHNDNEPSNDFESTRIVFEAGNKIKIKIDNDVIEGEWNLKDDCEVLEIKSTSNHELAVRLALEWNVVSFTSTSITLVYEFEENRTEMKLSI